ncbi:MAG: glycosyltransferase WbuB [Anaerolinea sp.]|nr:glycosyltransferase WbuB [Anaerolinea sp.]
MKVLLINQAFVSPDEPGHTRHYELAKYLHQHGHELVIVGSDINYQTGEKIIEHKGISTEQMINGVRVIRAFILPALHRSYFWRVLSFLSFMLSSVIVSLQVKDVDLVMGTTPPIFQAVSVWFIALLRHKPFLLEVRDLWPEFGISMGVLKNPLIITLSRWLESFLYARADHILVNSPAYVEYLCSRGIRAKKITFIPYGTDVQIFHPDVDGKAFRYRYGLQGRFMVLYAGALGQANDIYTLLRAAERLKAFEKIRFVLLGDGKERHNLEAEATRKGLNNVMFAGVVPKKEMPGAVAAADVCLAILQDIPMFRTTYPNKVFDYMAAGKPTVLVIDGVIRELLEASGGGVYVPPADDVALAQTLTDLSQQPEKLAGMGRSARQYILSHMDRQKKMAETMQLMLRMVKQ